MTNSDLNLNNDSTPTPCHSRKIPLWLVLLDNIPTIFLFILGFLIINIISIIAAILFAIYAVVSVIWFWARICPYCHHYETHACPCGYGIISSKLFSRKDSSLFKNVFKRNILIVFPNWFIPFFVGIYLLITQYSVKVLVLMIIFSIIGFLIIPLISKLVGCKNCEIKEDCPWMTINKQHNC
jgi:hypothetical protein